MGIMSQQAILTIVLVATMLPVCLIFGVASSLNRKEMENKAESQESPKGLAAHIYKIFYLGLGINFGLIIGNIFQDSYIRAITMLVGMCVGTIAGAVMDRSKKSIS